MMLTEQLDALAAALRGTGIPAGQAEEFAVQIGDTPEIDGDQIVVRSDAGEVLGRVPASILR